MQLGYVGLLEVDQVLILWDRLFGKNSYYGSVLPLCAFVDAIFSPSTAYVGYMDTNILAVFGVSVFLFRSVQLFHVSVSSLCILICFFPFIIIAVHVCVLLHL